MQLRFQVGICYKVTVILKIQVQAYDFALKCPAKEPQDTRHLNQT